MAKQKHEIPIGINEQLKLEVLALSSSGDGVCRYYGYTIFIPQAIPGDFITCKIVKTNPRFGIARLIEILIPSQNRTSPLCPVFPECGGCKLQQISYKTQLEYKVRVVLDNLKRIGNIVLSIPIQSSPAEPPWYFRNKGGFAIQKIAGNLSIGFFKQGTHEVIDSNCCDILHPQINTIKEIVRDKLVEFKVSIYNETKHRGFIRGIIVRHSQDTNEVLLGLITTEGTFSRDFVEKLLETISKNRISLAGIVQNLNVQKTNVILGNKNRMLWGRDYLVDQLDDLKFQISLPSFFQTNTQQTIKLYNLIREWVVPVQGIIVDAYCGVGGITIWLGREGHKIIGIEEVPEAINDAIKNAHQNQITSCEFVVGLVENELHKINKKIGLLILDPPRKGCAEQVIEFISKARPKKLIYISCNPSTLARDLCKLNNFQYTVKDICIFDMFPQTQHIEVAVLLTRE